MPFCTQCGFQNDDDARYCNGCGHELISEVSPPTGKRRGKGKWPGLIAGLVLLLAAGGTVLHLADVQLWPGDDSGSSRGSISIPDVPPVAKPRDIRRDISEIQKTASRTADKVFGSDQELGPIADPPHPLKKGLKDVEESRNYHYTHQNCNRLFSDVGQQVAHSIETELVRATAISAEEENRVGRELSRQMEKKHKGKIDIDRGWLSYIQSLGKSLTSTVKRKGIDYRFHVIHKDVFNAVAMPGGNIYIYTGLLNQIQNEAQLANVLAHEIKHVDLRHCIALYQIIKNLPGVIVNPTAIVSKFIKHPYNARLEADADRRALELAYGFGYSPYQIVNLWGNRIKEKDTAKTKKERGLFGDVMDTVTDEVKNIWNTHPENQKRSCLLKNHIIKLQKAYPMDRVYVGKWNFENRIPMFKQEM